MTHGECMVGILITWLALGGLMVTAVAVVHLVGLWRIRRRDR